MNELQIFNYEEQQVRTTFIENEPWWVLIDVCNALGIKNQGNAAKRLDDDEKMTVHLADSHSGQRGGAQKRTLVNEAGLFKTIIRSDSPKAKPFTRWVTHEVLPSIRKTGTYSVSKEKMYSFKDLQEAMIEGYNMGYEVGCKENMHGTYNQAYRTGYELGHTAGLKDSEHIYDRATTYNQGFQDGYKSGYDTGYDSAYKETFRKGFNKGYAIAIDNTKD